MPTLNTTSTPMLLIVGTHTDSRPPHEDCHVEGLWHRHTIIKAANQKLYDTYAYGGIVSSLGRRNIKITQDRVEYELNEHTWVLRVETLTQLQAYLREIEVGGGLYECPINHGYWVLEV